MRSSTRLATAGWIFWQPTWCRQGEAEVAGQLGQLELPQHSLMITEFRITLTLATELPEERTKKKLGAWKRRFKARQGAAPPPEELPSQKGEDQPRRDRETPGPHPQILHEGTGGGPKACQLEEGQAGGR